jgi:phosphohistidine phosphatase
MLTLILLRHAKSSWIDPDLGDHERQLTKRGAKAAGRMGRYIAENNLTPDLILCSDAIRTRATLALVLQAFGSPQPQTIIAEDLYLASPGTILTTIASQAGDARSIMVIGHNPGMHALALSLPAHGEKSDFAELAIKYPTAGLVEIAFDIEAWDALQPATGVLKRFIVPRSLAGP